MKLVDYASGVMNAALGRHTEGFTDMGSLFGSLKSLYSSLPILLILHMTAMFVYGLGAARLSYCYQMSTNPTATLFYVYVLLAFFFSPVYYPFYGIFLNPLCVKR
jgi:hypothetical protein